MSRLPSTPAELPAPRGRLILFVIAVGLVFAYLGWADAHAEIARECKRLGGFYVGSETFVCRLQSQPVVALEGGVA